MVNKKIEMSKKLIYPEIIRHFIYNAQGLNYESRVMTLSNAICEYFKISTENLMQHCRKGEIIDARRLYISVLNKNLNMKPPEIAKYTGFDRTTVLYHIKKIPNFIETEKKYREIAESVDRGLKDHNIIF